MFQLRHHNALAETIRNTKLERPGHTTIKPKNIQSITANIVADVVTAIADMLQEDNPNFDRMKFVRRCGWH